MVIADTDILIGAIRGNPIAKKLLIKYSPNIYISVVSEMELYVGATNAEKKKIVREILQNHDVILLSKSISDTALRLIKSYNTPNRSLYMPDALIAATCIDKGLSLLTFNISDFKFIKGLKLVK